MCTLDRGKINDDFDQLDERNRTINQKNYHLAFQSKKADSSRSLNQIEIQIN
jgi:hypothetical protein